MTTDMNMNAALDPSAMDMTSETTPELGTTTELDEHNLYVKGLWKECTQVELDDLFKQFGVITQSRVYGDGVGFVRFETPEAAKLAIETMHNKRPDPRSHETLLVKYAYRKVRNNKRVIRIGKDDVEMIMNKNTNNVYLRCLPPHFTEKELTELCNPYGQLTCTRVRENGVAFVRFRYPENAQHAIRELNGKLMSGSPRPLLAKLANSDPFQPKIGFRTRNMEECEEDTPVRVIEDEKLAAALLAAAKNQIHPQTANGSEEMMDPISADVLNTLLNNNRRKDHNHTHRENNNNMNNNNNSMNHRRRQRRNNYRHTANNNTNSGDIGNSNNSHNHNNNSNKSKNHSHINNTNRGLLSMHGHNDYHSNNMNGLQVGLSNLSVTTQPHLVGGTELFQTSQPYGMVDSSMYAYQGGYPYYGYVGVGNGGTNNPTGMIANNTTMPSTATSTTNGTYYTGTNVNYQYPQMVSNNSQTVNADLMNGVYNVLPLNNAQSITSKQSLSDMGEFGYAPMTPQMDGTLGGSIDISRDTIPQTQVSESMTPQSHMLSLDNSSILFSTQTKDNVKAEDLKEKNGLLKDRVRGGSQAITGTSNTGVTASLQSVNKLNVPGVQLPKVAMPSQPLFISPGPGSEYSSVLSTGSACMNIAPSSHSTNKFSSMAGISRNNIQRFLSPGSQQVLDLQSQLPQSPGNVSWQQNSNTGGPGFNTPGNHIKLFGPVTTTSSSSGIAINGNNSMNTAISTTGNNNMNWAMTTPIQKVTPIHNTSNNNNNNNNSNDGIDRKIGDQMFAAVFKRYPQNTKRITGQLLQDYSSQECLRLLENPNELKVKIDEIVQKLNIREM